MSGMSFNTINLWSAAGILLLLLPNIWYAVRGKGPDLSSGSRALNALEQVGRYGSMLLAVVPLGVGEFGFRSAGAFLLWLALTAGLLSAYYICWFLYARRASPALTLALAALPSALFLVHGLLLRHPALCVFAGIFAASHIYIACQSAGKR